MKKNIVLLMTLILCLSMLAACGKSPAVESGEPSSPAASPSPESTGSPSEQPSQEPSNAPSQEPAATDAIGIPSGGEPSESVSPSLTLSMTDATITYAGYVLTLKPTFDGFGADNTALSWSSSDESVATVDQNGNVTSVAPGKAIITAETYTGIQASCIVRCRWTEETPAPSETAAPTQRPTGVDLSAFAADIISKYELPSFLQLADAELTEAFYSGLSAVGAKQLLVYINQMSMNMGELVLVEVRNSADVSTVKAILQARIDYMVGDGNGPGGAWYPTPTEEWTNNSRVVSSGNYVMMVVDDDCDAIVDEFNALV